MCIRTKMNNRPTTVVHQSPRVIPRSADELLTQTIDLWYGGVRTMQVQTMLKLEENSVDWTCYVCKTKTKVVIPRSKEVSVRTMWCEDCRPENITPLHKADLSLIRYVNSFYSMLKEKIVENSNIKTYYSE